MIYLPKGISLEIALRVQIHKKRSTFLSLTSGMADITYIEPLKPHIAILGRKRPRDSVGLKLGGPSMGGSRANEVSRLSNIMYNRCLVYLVLRLIRKWVSTAMYPVRNLTQTRNPRETIHDHTNIV